MLPKSACHPCPGATLTCSVSFQFKGLCCRSDHLLVLDQNNAALRIINKISFSNFLPLGPPPVSFLRALITASL